MMLNLGAFRLGEYIPIHIQTHDSNRTPVKAVAAPTAKVYSSTNTLVETVSLPITDTGEITGFHRALLYLGSLYSPGIYDALVSWVLSGTTRSILVRFEVLRGGSSEGQGIGLRGYSSAAGNYLVMQNMGSGNIKGFLDARLE